MTSDHNSYHEYSSSECEIHWCTISQLHLMEFIETVDVALYYLKYAVVVCISLTKGTKDSCIQTPRTQSQMALNFGMTSKSQF